MSDKPSIQNSSASFAAVIGQPEAWSTFLPEGAILMGRASVDEAKNVRPEELQSRESSQIFFRTTAPQWSAEATTLFQKMLGSIALDLSRVEIVRDGRFLHPNALVLDSTAETAELFLPDPEQILARPELKRQAWQTLKALKIRLEEQS